MMTFSFSLGVFFGCILSFIFISLLSKRVDKKLKNKTNNCFTEVLNKFKDNEVNFDCRLNHVVQFSLSIPEEDEISLVYFIDKHELSIFKKNKAIYYSNNLRSEILDDIMDQIWNKFSNSINDVTTVYNFTYDRASFLKLSELQRHENQQDIEVVQDVVLDLDDILDKINEVGYDNLNDSEKEFLKKYKND